MSPNTSESAKGLWENEFGGGVRAAASGKAITGFRAGVMGLPGFTGAIIADDLLKPDDAHSEAKRKRVNERIGETLFNRLAHEDVPIIIIMQRLHEDDVTGFLLSGGSQYKWHHLELPALVGDPDIGPYPEEWTHGIPILHDLADGPLWEYKNSESQILQRKEANPYVYAAQDNQRPNKKGGVLFKTEDWQYWETLPPLKLRFIFADTAFKEKEKNDFSVLQCLGLSRDGLRIYLIDQLRGKWDSVNLKKNFIAFASKHNKPSKTYGRLARAYVEDKASGTGLIQDVGKTTNIPIKGIARKPSEGKVFRAVVSLPYFNNKQVWIPAVAPWLADYIKEFAKFSPEMTHAHDDQVDPTVDAVTELLSKSHWGML